MNLYILVPVAFMGGSVFGAWMNQQVPLAAVGSLFMALLLIAGFLGGFDNA